MSAKLITILWRDIPAQIVAKKKREAHRVELPSRFQVAIDRTAMEAGLTGIDEYLAEWRQEGWEFEGDLEAGAASLVSDLGAALPQETLNAYAANRGKTPTCEGNL